MHHFVEFLGFINEQIHTRRIERLESMLMSPSLLIVVLEAGTAVQRTGVD